MLRCLVFRENGLRVSEHLRNLGFLGAIVGGTLVGPAVGVAAVGAGGAIIVGLLSNLWTGELAARREARRSGPAFAQPNHDLTCLIGEAIARVLYGCAERYPDHARWLRALAKAAQAHYADVASHPSLQHVASERLPLLFEAASQSSDKETVTLLDELVPGQGQRRTIAWMLVEYLRSKARKKSDTARHVLAESAIINGLFPAIREMFKRDPKRSSRAYAALQLDVNGEILARLSEVAKSQQQALAAQGVHGNHLRQIAEYLQHEAAAQQRTLTPDQLRDMAELIDGFRSLAETIDQVLFQVWLLRDDLADVRNTQQDQATKEDITRLKLHFEELIAKVLDAAPSRMRLAPHIPYLPHTHNQYFFGREPLIASMHGELSGPAGLTLRGTVLVLVGMGGVGKTTLVREYVDRHHATYAHVLWVNAASQGSVLDSLRHHYDSVGLPVTEELHQRPSLNPVVRLLRTERPTLIVIDNAADEAAIQSLVPSVGLCRTLITSRFTAWSASARIMTVPVFSPGIGKEFLRRRMESLAGPVSQDDALESLVRTLGCLPLALEQAAVFMLKHGMAVREYLRHIGESRSELLAEGVLGSTNYPDSVATIWLTAYNRLSTAARAVLFTIVAHAAERPISADALSTSGDVVAALMADVFHQDPLGAPSRPDAPLSELAVRSALAELTDRSIAEHGRGSVWLHPLVQAVFQQRLVLLGYEPRENFGGLLAMRHMVSGFASAELGVRKSLSLLVVGEAHDGSTFVWNGSHIAGDRIVERLRVDLAAIQSASDLESVFRRVATASSQQRVPIVSVVNIEAPQDGKRYGLLRYFLPPMQDGVASVGGEVLKLGPVVFVFQTAVRDFLRRHAFDEQMRRAKVPDFLSRLRGHLMIG